MSIRPFSPQMRSHRGHTLVEILAVVALLGLITALVLPNISHVNTVARESAARRNAQVVSSTFAGAKSAGVNLWGPTTTPNQIMADLRRGVSPPDGLFKDKIFIVSSLPEESSQEYNEMMGYLDWDTNTLQLYYNGHF